MDQLLQEQDPFTASGSPLSATTGQLADSIVRQSGALAGLDPISQMSLVLTSTILREGWEFEVGGEAIDASKISDPECLLPMLMWEIERLHQTALAEPAGVEFVVDPQARYGVRPMVTQWDSRCASLVVMALEPLYVAKERYEGRLDYLVDQFFADYGRGLIPWSASSPSNIIESSRQPLPESGDFDQYAPIP